MALPAFRSLGTFVATNTGTLTPGMPTGWQPDDILIITWRHANAATAPTGWDYIGTDRTASNFRYSTLIRRAQSGDTSPTFAASGNACARMAAYSGVTTSDPPYEDVQQGNKGTASTSFASTGITTTAADRLYLCCIGRGGDSAAAFFSNHVCTNASNIQERIDQGHTNGLGGGIALFESAASSAGSYGAWTADMTNTVDGWHEFALIPPTAATGGSVTADAILQSTVPSSYTSNSILLGSVSDGFVADSVLALVISGAFSANSVIFATVSGSYTADSALVVATSTVGGSFTADSILFKTVSGSYTADSALVVATSTVGGSFTANSMLRINVVGPSKTANAQFKAVRSVSFLANAWLLEPGTGVFSAGAVLVRQIFGDDFNRVVAAGFGTPSLGNPYINESSYYYPDSYASVDGAIASAQWGYYVNYSPSASDGLVSIDFYTVTDYPTMDISSARSNSGSVIARINEGSGLWYPSLINPYVSAELALELNTWYTLKAWLSTDGITESWVKVWKRSDPEPAAPQVISVQEPLHYSGNPTLSIGTGVDPINIDNFYVWQGNATLYSAFSANAVISQIAAGTVGKAFTANAKLIAPNVSRFYFPSSGLPPVYPELDSSWSLGLNNRYSTYTRKTGTPPSLLSYFENNNVRQNVILAQYVSDPLAPQTISGSLYGIVATSKSGTDQYQSQLVVKLVDSSGVFKDYVYPQDPGLFGLALTNSATLFTRVIPRLAQNDWVDINPVTVDPGDRLVFEIGHRTGTGSSTTTGRIQIGDTDPDFPFTNDYVGFDATATPGSGWLQFSQEILFLSFTFTADAVITGANSFEFTADAMLTEPYTSIPLDAVIKKTASGSFTANARLVRLTSATFTANAYLNTRSTSSFSANARLYLPPPPSPSRTPVRKVTTLTVASRRERPSQTYLPPREMTSPDAVVDPRVRIPGCLPPCPGVVAGPGSEWGANGVAIRQTVVYCANCDASYIGSERNQLGRDSGTTAGHICCQTSHSNLDHKYRMWVQYPSIPTTPFDMRAKLKWVETAGYPESVRIKVYGNIGSLPNIDVGTCVPYTGQLFLDMWESGEYLGDLMFYKTGGSGGYYWDDTPTSLTIDPARLSTNIFKFVLGDEANYINPQFVGGSVGIA